jgi:hypothetical protein
VQRERNNVEKNVEQRVEPKQLGGITGRGFLPGRSGNPNGRPRTRGLVSALHAKVSEVGPDGRSIEQQLVDVLLHEALRGKHRLAAVEVIFDRLEGRASQHIQIADVTKELRQKSDDELRFHLEHDRWPEESELPESGGRQNEVEEYLWASETSCPRIGSSRRRSSLCARRLLLQSWASRSPDRERYRLPVRPFYRRTRC